MDRVKSRVSFGVVLQLVVLRLVLWQLVARAGSERAQLAELVSARRDAALPGPMEPPRGPPPRIATAPQSQATPPYSLPPDHRAI